MALKDILAISGKSGLFKFVSQGRNGIIVESLTDQKRAHVPATAKISALEDIAIFTDTEEVPLANVMKNIRERENGQQALDTKSASNEDLKEYMAEVLPEYDRERVYVSDIKKLIAWYNLLQSLNMLDKLDEADKEEDAEEKTTDEAKEETVTEEPKEATEKKGQDDKKA